MSRCCSAPTLTRRTEALESVVGCRLSVFGRRLSVLQAPVWPCRALTKIHRMHTMQPQQVPRLSDMKRILFFLVFSMAGCASPMSTLQTARTTPKGDVDAYVGIGANVSTSLIGSISDLGEDAADKAKAQIDQGQTPNLTQQDRENIIGAAISYGLFGPVPVAEFGVRYGLMERWDVGAAYTSAGFKLETKVMFLSQRTDGFDLSLGVVGQRQSYEPPVPSFLKDVFQLEDIKRTNIAFNLLAGKHFGRNAFVYGGPKLVYTNLELGFIEQISDSTANSVVVDDSFVMAGAVVGGGLGWKYVFFMLELNALYYNYEATILDTPLAVSGIDFYPALAFRVQFY